MLENIVSQFMQSGAGKDVLSQLKQQGLEGAQAQSAISATAEGAMQQVSSGGIGGMVGGLLGGAAPAQGAGAGAGIAAQVAQFVSQKTGLSPAIAQSVVGVALPKVLELIQGQAQPPAAGAKPSIGGLLGGLIK